MKPIPTMGRPRPKAALRTPPRNTSPVKPRPDTPLDAIRRTIRHLEERRAFFQRVQRTLGELEESNDLAVMCARDELRLAFGNRAADAASTAALLRGYLESIGEPHIPEGPGWTQGESQ